MPYSRPEIVSGSTRLNKPFVENLLDGIDEVTERDTGAKKQSILLGKAMRNMRKGVATKIVVRGDSTTYGHDTVSGDIVAPPAGPLPDGTSHSFTRSPKPYPTAMQDYLNLTYPGNVVTVENQGYSGDWVQRGFTRWTANANAQITVISYGINDASASYVPDEYRGNVDLFVEWHEKMILRDLAWGSAVVLLTSTRQRGTNGNPDTDTFRNALQALADKYGIPLLDGEQFLLNASWDAWSDGNHLTTKGNSIMGARLAAVFIGEGPQSPRVVDSGSKLQGRPTLDNLVLNGGAQTSANNGYGTARDDSAMTAGHAIQLGGSFTDGVATWSFYAETPDLYVMPYSYVGPTTGEAAAQITYELDFGVEQGQNYHQDQLDPMGLNPPNGLRAVASVVHGPFAFGAGNSFERNPATTPIFLRVATPGWHTIRARLQRSNTTSQIVTHVMELFESRVWQGIRKDASLQTQITNNNNNLVARYEGKHILVPAAFDESVDILTTKVNWPTLMRALGVKDWTSAYLGAPAIGLTVRSYGVGLMRYMFLCTQRLDQAGTDVAAQAVDATPVNETSTSLPVVKKLEALSTAPSGVTPENSITGRELASIAYEASTQSLVFTWRTTNTTGGTAKNMKKNFVMDFQLY